MEKQSRPLKESKSPVSRQELNLSYESALEQLEDILDKMNGSVSLEDSVTLYERADRLLHHCSGKLGEAESKIETLVKNRSGDFVLGGDGKPQVQTAPDKESEPMARLEQETREPNSDDLPF